MKTLPVNARIQIKIREQTPQGEFNDSLYFTKAEWDQLTQEELNFKIQQRVNNWVEIISHPPIAAEPTKAELEEMARHFQERLDEVNTKIVTKAIELK